MHFDMNCVLALNQCEHYQKQKIQQLVESVSWIVLTELINLKRFHLGMKTES